MASDLKRSGYRRLDVVRIYGFNLILLPVNLAGVVKSIEQLITGRKIPFARTPKVRDRTATPLLFAVAPIALIAFCVWSGYRDLHLQHWANLAFDVLNASLALYGVVAFMGVRTTLRDVAVGLVDKLFVTEKVKGHRAVRAAAPQPWREIIDLGVPNNATRAAEPRRSRRTQQLL